MTSSSGSAHAGSIFHIALASDWAEAQQAGEYRISTIGSTLDEVGFIHASYAAQVAATAERFYRGIAEPLVLLQIDTSAVPVVVEPAATDGAPAGAGEELFPHIYGPIPVSAVLAALPVGRNGEGFELPEL